MGRPYKAAAYIKGSCVSILCYETSTLLTVLDLSTFHVCVIWYLGLAYSIVLEHSWGQKQLAADLCTGAS